jgi:hypothetical protein
MVESVAGYLDCVPCFGVGAEEVHNGCAGLRSSQPMSIQLSFNRYDRRSRLELEIDVAACLR